MKKAVKFVIRLTVVLILTGCGTDQFINDVQFQLNRSILKQSDSIHKLPDNLHRSLKDFLGKKYLNLKFDLEQKFEDSEVIIDKSL